MQNLENRLTKKLIELKIVFDALLNEVIVIKSQGDGNSRDIKNLFSKIKKIESSINAILEALDADISEKKIEITSRKKFPDIKVILLFLGSIFSIPFLKYFSEFFE